MLYYNTWRKNEWIVENSYLRRADTLTNTGKRSPCTPPDPLKTWNSIARTSLLLIFMILITLLLLKMYGCVQYLPRASPIKCSNLRRYAAQFGNRCSSRHNRKTEKFHRICDPCAQHRCKCSGMINCIITRWRHQMQFWKKPDVTRRDTSTYSRRIIFSEWGPNPINPPSWPRARRCPFHFRTAIIYYQYFLKCIKCSKPSDYYS